MYIWKIIIDKSFKYLIFFPYIKKLMIKIFINKKVFNYRV